MTSLSRAPTPLLLFFPQAHCICYFSPKFLEHFFCLCNVFQSPCNPVAHFYLYDFLNKLLTLEFLALNFFLSQIQGLSLTLPSTMSSNGSQPQECEYSFLKMQLKYQLKGSTLKRWGVTC